MLRNGFIFLLLLPFIDLTFVMPFAYTLITVMSAHVITQIQMIKYIMGLYTKLLIENEKRLGRGFSVIILNA